MHRIHGTGSPFTYMNAGSLGNTIQPRLNYIFSKGGCYGHLGARRFFRKLSMKKHADSPHHGKAIPPMLPPFPIGPYFLKRW